MKALKWISQPSFSLLSPALFLFSFYSSYLRLKVIRQQVSAELHTQTFCSSKRSFSCFQIGVSVSHADHTSFQKTKLKSPWRLKASSCHDEMKSDGPHVVFMKSHSTSRPSSLLRSSILISFACLGVHQYFSRFIIQTGRRSAVVTVLRSPRWDVETLSVSGFGKNMCDCVEMCVCVCCSLQMFVVWTPCCRRCERLGSVAGFSVYLRIYQKKTNLWFI